MVLGILQFCKDVRKLLVKKTNLSNFMIVNSVCLEVVARLWLKISVNSSQLKELGYKVLRI